MSEDLVSRVVAAVGGAIAALGGLKALNVWSAKLDSTKGQYDTESKFRAELLASINAKDAQITMLEDKVEELRSNKHKCEDDLAKMSRHIARLEEDAESAKEVQRDLKEQIGALREELRILYTGFTIDPTIKNE